MIQTQTVWCVEYSETHHIGTVDFFGFFLTDVDAESKHMLSAI